MATFITALSLAGNEMSFAPFMKAVWSSDGNEMPLVLSIIALLPSAGN